MLPNEISTGSKQFDKLIKGFYYYYNSNEYKEFRKAIDSGEISEDIIKSLPMEFIILCSSLANDDTYNDILGRAKKSSHQIIKETKEIINKEFKKLIDNPLFEDYTMEIGVKSKAVGEEKVISKIFNKPGKQSLMPLLVGYPPDLTPVIRISLLNKYDAIIFDSTFNWGEVLFLASGLLEAISDQFSKLKSLSENGQLSIEKMDKELMRELIKEIDSKIESIKEHAPMYGIEIKK